MNVGEDKGRIVAELIHEAKPEIMLELGGYCGYSTILFADAQRSAGGKRYYSLERSPKFAKVIETLVEIAGLSDFVEMVVGPSNEGIKILHVAGKVKKIDMMFLDHYKPAYTTDLKLCESLGLIQKGTILAADNVIKPGNPPYLVYVRSSVEEKRKRILEQGRKDTENFPGRAAKQYGDVEELSMEVKGNPEIVYESRLVNSFEPTGVPVSFLASNSLDYADCELRMELKSRDVLKCRLEKTRYLLQFLNRLSFVKLYLYITSAPETSL
jgi:catechol O-methyltransferase